MNFLPVLRELVLAYQAFERYSAPDVRSMGLTVSQFDVIVTLGNQPPMSCKDLGEKTLITKGTLTGLLERLEAKALIQRKVHPNDARSQLVGLSVKGQKLFEEIFPQHLAFLEKAFEQLSDKQLSELQVALNQLKNIFLRKT